MADTSQLLASLRERHQHVSIGAPRVSRLRGVLPRYDVSWTEEITDSGVQWGWCRTVWFRRRAYSFADRFVVLLPASTS